MAKPLVLPLLLATSLALAGCKSSADKAEDYYQSGLSYLAKGDDERALLEFRNTFSYDGFHKEARRAYGDVLIRRGEISEAYGQYLRLVEQYPDDVPARRILAELALDGGNWEEARRHGEVALQGAPNDPELAPIRLSLAYQSAALLRDDAARAEHAKEARSLLEGPLAGNLFLRRILIDDRLAAGDQDEVLALITAALADKPDMFDMQMLRYSILSEKGDKQALGAQLKQMAELFPEDERVRGSLISWYISEGDAEGAEGYMRKLAGERTGPSQPHLSLVGALMALKGTEAARAELEALRKANEGTALAGVYGVELARMTFGEGKSAEAISMLRAMLQGTEPSDETRVMSVALAQMLDQTGENAEAKTIVNQVLEADRSQVGALKLRAAWAIKEDRPGDAVVDLRTALDQAPRDAEVLTLMAEAHERDGSPELAGERLALALEVADGALPQTMRYVNFLIENNRLQVASRVLNDALQRFPQSVEIVGSLSDLYIREQMWDRALEMVERLETLPLNEAGKARARTQRAAILTGQNRADEALSMLTDSAAADGSVVNTAALLQLQVKSGRLAEARSLIDKERADHPDQPALRIFDAALAGIEGNLDRAEMLWREAVVATPQAEMPVQMLYSHLRGMGQHQEASEVLDAALARLEQPSGRLRWLKAGELEAAGKIEETIALYEQMYEEDSSNLVVANNLASLISTRYSDEANLERAERIARRLRGQDVAPFQDTYGWIALRRGNLEDALSHLEPAAKGLPEDAMVQMHLGLLYEKLDRPAEAKAQLQKALELGAKGQELPELAQARDALERLKNAAEPAKP